MNLPNVGYAATNFYSISHIPTVTLYIPGKAKMIHGSNWEKQSIVEFAKAHFEKLTPEQKQAARDAGSKSLPDVNPDLMFRITYPDTGTAIDTRTNQAWVDVPVESVEIAGFDEADL